MPMLGKHAVHYMFMHYFTAKSTVLVANIYSRFSNDAGEFVRRLTAMGLAPRHAAYLWTIISPEIGIPGYSSPHVTGEAGPSNVRASSEVEASARDQGGEVADRPTGHTIQDEPTEPNTTHTTEHSASNEMDMDIEYDDRPYEAETGGGDHAE